MKALTLLPALAALCSASSASCPSPYSSANTTQACQQLMTALPGKVAMKPSSSAGGNSSSSLASLYTSTQQTYWDHANTFDSPACMVFPSAASDVAVVINTLTRFADVPLALKSGGHNWNRGFSSTNGGVLVSFRPSLQSVVPSADGKTVDVGPGARWREVIGTLDKQNRTAVGGRADDVGVGGYVVLGGVSFLSAQYGFASDGVANFEVVLANGTITNANATHNPDLYFSMRGGATNFGVVTKYTLLTHPIGQVWGGQLDYSNNQSQAVLSAITNFTAAFDASTKKSAILPNIIWLNGTATWSVLLFHDGPTRPAGVFDQFFAIGPSSDATKTQSYPDILISGGTSNESIGHTSNRFAPYPNLPSANMTDFMQWHYEQINASRLLRDPSLSVVFLNIALQSLPVELQKSNAVGSPGALAVDPDGGDKIWIEYSLFFTNASAADGVSAAFQDLTNTAQMHQQTTYKGVKPTKYVSGQLPDVAYNPLFANDAQTDQKVFRSYGMQTYQKMVETRKAYDPDMFFQKRNRGFHLELPSY